jgi:hypothetical protein
MSSFGSAVFPVQLPVAEPTPSEDEMNLMFEVETLQTQLSDAGRPVDKKFAHLFIQSVTPKPLPERGRRWQAIRDHLQKLVDHPHATSTEVPQRIRHYHWIICKKWLTMQLPQHLLFCRPLPAIGMIWRTQLPQHLLFCRPSPAKGMI